MEPEWPCTCLPDWMDRGLCDGCKRNEAARLEAIWNADVHITERGVAFPVLDPNGGFGQIVVELEPGQRETITRPNGRQVTVIRDHLN